MMSIFKLMMLVALLGLAQTVAFADQQLPASSIEQPDFSPPPMPEFMLRKPDKPLTLEQMKQQADEASRKVRAEKAKNHKKTRKLKKND